MIVSYEWLKQYVDITLPAEELAEKLTLTGTKVEGVEFLGEEIRNVVVGRVEAIEPHPNSDKLLICRVKVSEAGDILQIVTGAQNLKTGDLVPVALEGSVLPGGKHIGRAELRGIESRGMLVSEQELGLEKESAGIMVISGSPALGTDIRKVTGQDDYAIELEITPNRPDCLCMTGVAREIAAFSNQKLRLPDIAVEEAGEPAAAEVSVEVLDPQLCPRYIARVVRNVKIGPSPSWMQQCLRACGVRPINNIVDITNYVMLELNQPMHAFDLDNVSGKKIIVRRAQKGESMETLDGVTRTLTEDMLLICDADKPVALAGVMGGANSEVSDSTVNILFESAVFDRVSIWKTSKATKLRTEASSRYEKGLDPENAQRAIDRAAALVVALGAGEVAPGRVDVYAGQQKPMSMELRPERINKILGTKLAVSEMTAILERLGFQTTGSSNSGGNPVVTVPTFRQDVTREADLVEEIARIYGYDTVEPTLPKGVTMVGGMSRDKQLANGCMDFLVSCGFYEVLTYAFTNPKSLDRAGIDADSPLRRYIKISNPITEDFSIMRTTLVPSILEIAERNVSRRSSDMALFEVAKVYWPEAGYETSRQPREVRMLSGLAMGTIGEVGWNRPANDVDFYDMKGLILELLDRVGVSDIDMKRSDKEYLHPGRSAVIASRDAELGVFGELHPETCKEYGLPKRAYCFELNLDAVIANAGKEVLFAPVPKYPALKRDLAILLSVDTCASDIERIIREEAGPILESIRLFDRYMGKQIPEGYQSMAYSVTYRAADRTLTDDEVAKVQNKVEEALNHKLGARIRS